MAKQTPFQISDQNWSGRIMPTFLMGGKYGGPLLPPGGIGGLEGIQVQNLGGNVPVENHTGSLRQTNNQGLERNELKICI